MRLGLLFAGIAVAIGAAAAFAACDPSEDPAVTNDGPPFVIVGRAAQQPSDPSLGISVYVQSRGGGYVGILTHGCTHTVATTRGATESCSEVAGVGADPLYLTLDPSGRECVVEARLYALSDRGSSFLDAGTQPSFGLCDLNGRLVASTSVPFAPVVPNAFEDAGDAASLPETGTADAGDAGAANAGEGGADAAEDAPKTPDSAPDATGATDATPSGDS